MQGLSTTLHLADMTEETRRLGEPYLQDRDVISEIARLRSNYHPQSEQGKQIVDIVYNQANRFYAREIKKDRERISSLIKTTKLNSDSLFIADWIFNIDEALKLFPYLKELALNFDNTLKKYQENMESMAKRAGFKMSFKTYGNITESYLSAIDELGKISLLYGLKDVSLKNKNQDDEQPDKASTIQKLKDKGVFKGIDPIKIKTLDDNFEPDEALSDTELIIIILNICNEEYQKGDTPTRLQSLNDNFTPKRNYKSLGVGKRYKVCAMIFGFPKSRVEREARIYHRELGKLNNLFE